MNLCPEQYDAIEIQAVRMEIGHDGKTICFPCRPDEADNPPAKPLQCPGTRLGRRLRPRHDVASAGV